MNMAKLAFKPSVDYGQFKTEDDFWLWVATNHGTEVVDACKKYLAEELGKNRSVKAMRVLEKITLATDRVDVTKNQLRARFAW